MAFDIISVVNKKEIESLMGYDDEDDEEEQIECSQNDTSVAEQKIQQMVSPETVLNFKGTSPLGLEKLDSNDLSMEL